MGFQQEAGFKARARKVRLALGLLKSSFEALSTGMKMLKF
jgi:hypothetical protein